MYKRIMIVVDDAPVAQAAVREGTALAAAHGAEAFYFGLPPDLPASSVDAAGFGEAASYELVQAAVARTEDLLAKAMSGAERAGVFAHRICSKARVGARAVAEAAQRRRCDLIVVATDERNAVMRLLNGSLVPGLITSSPVPVLVCRDAAPGRAH